MSTDVVAPTEWTIDAWPGEIIPAHHPRDLSLLAKGKQILAEARTICEVMEIRDQAEAIRHYLRRRDHGIDIQNEAAEIVILANFKIGEWSKSIPLAPHASEGLEDCLTMEQPSKDAVLDDSGIKRGLAYRCEKLADLGEDTVAAFIRETRAAGKELTMAGVLRLANRTESRSPVEQSESPAGSGIVGSLRELIDRGDKFGTIYADPPWRYSNKSTRSAADGEYPTMSLDEICAEPVSQLAAEDAHLHLWTTNAFLFDAKSVIEAWGFKYKSCFVWVKPQVGIGNYWRVSHEFLLFGVRGNAPFRARDEKSWLQHDRGEHSAKPRLVREKIEKVSPGPYLEMYGRTFSPSSCWTVYGNQVKRLLF